MDGATIRVRWNPLLLEEWGEVGDRPMCGPPRIGFYGWRGCNAAARIIYFAPPGRNSMGGNLFIYLSPRVPHPRPKYCSLTESRLSCAVRWQQFFRSRRNPLDRNLIFERIFSLTSLPGEVTGNTCVRNSLLDSVVATVFDGFVEFIPFYMYIYMHDFC